MKRRCCIREHAFKKEGVNRYLNESGQTLMTVALKNAGISNILEISSYRHNYDGGMI
jgi:hypothetical protein